MKKPSRVTIDRLLLVASISFLVSITIGAIGQIDQLRKIRLENEQYRLASKVEQRDQMQILCRQYFNYMDTPDAVDVTDLNVICWDYREFRG